MYCHKVFTSCTSLKVPKLVCKCTLVKVKVLIQLHDSSKRVNVLFAKKKKNTFVVTYYPPLTTIIGFSICILVPVLKVFNLYFEHTHSKANNSYHIKIFIIF